MGADMIIQHVPAFKSSPERIAALKQIVEIMDEESQDFSMFSKEEVLASIDEYPTLQDSREITLFVPEKGSIYYVTGGLSWGDSPTEIFDTLQKMATINDVWDKMMAFMKEDQHAISVENNKD